MSTSEYRSSYGTVAEPDVTIGMQRRHTVMEGEWRDGGALWQAIKFQWGHTQYTHTEYPGAEVGTRFDNAGNALRLEARQQPKQLDQLGQLDGVVGLQREGSRLTAQGAEAFVPSSRTQSSALFTLQTLKTAWGQVSAAARAEGVSVASLDQTDSTRFPAEEKRFRPYSVAVGMMRNFRQGEAQEGWQLTSNLGWSQRAPKDYELFANGPHAATGTYEQGERRSALEKATQLDVGGAWKKGPHTFGLTGFVSRFASYLSLQPTGEFKDATGTVVGAATPDRLPVYQYEGVQARFVGLESSAKLRMVGGQHALWTPIASHGNLDLELRADTVRADDLTYQRPLPRIAPLRLGADWVWTHAAWGARLGLLHAGAQHRVPNVGDVTTASYTLLNAGVNYHSHWGKTHWMAFAKLDNLTNRLAYSSTSVLTQTMGVNAPPLAGRSLKLGVQASF
jgi:iron complex outermembrane receptor protein